MKLEHSSKIRIFCQLFKFRVTVDKKGAKNAKTPSVAMIPCEINKMNKNQLTSLFKTFSLLYVISLFDSFIAQQAICHLIHC